MLCRAGSVFRRADIYALISTVPSDLWKMRGKVECTSCMSASIYWLWLAKWVGGVHSLVCISVCIAASHVSAEKWELGIRIFARRLRVWTVPVLGRDASLFAELEL